MRRDLGALFVVFLCAPLWGADAAPAGVPAAGALDPPTATTAPAALAGPWGATSGSFQSRLKVTGDVGKRKALHVVAELRNVSDQKLGEKNIRVWLMVAQGSDMVFYSAPYAGTPKSLGAGEAVEIVFEAGDLAAFKYAANLELHDGLPASPDPKAPAAKSVGKLSEILPVGGVKARVFVVVTPGVDPDATAKAQAEVVVSGTLALKVADVEVGDLSTMDETAKTAFFAELDEGFRRDAVAGKNAHDRALKAGAGVAPELVKLLDDKKLSEAGQMWLAATLVDLNDNHYTDALIKIVEKGGAAARVVAYHGPRLKDAKLTAAIEKAAAATKDPGLTAWAVRGLGINGEKVDGSLLEAMVAHSDAAGRAEAADILAGHADARAVPLLAKLITDDDATVRLAAIRAAIAHAKKDKEILAALDKAAALKDDPTVKAAEAARKTLGDK